jgi:ABC-2 type transport system permease protein
MIETRERSDHQPQRRAVSMSTLVVDTRNVFQREMSLVLRDPFSIIFSLVQPLVFLGCSGRSSLDRWIRPR